MKLSLSQAAEQLGKTRRQIRYMIQEGRLQARKDGGRWVVDSEALPLDDPQRAARARRQDRLREAADHALGPRPATRWGLRDLKAIGVGVPLYRRCLDLLGEDAAPTRELGPVWTCWRSARTATAPSTTRPTTCAPRTGTTTGPMTGTTTWAFGVSVPAPANKPSQRDVLQVPRGPCPASPPVRSSRPRRPSGRAALSAHRWAPPRADT